MSKSALQKSPKSPIECATDRVGKVFGISTAKGIREVLDVPFTRERVLLFRHRIGAVLGEYFTTENFWNECELPPSSVGRIVNDVERRLGGKVAREDIEKRVKKILVFALGAEEEKVTLRSILDSDLGAESIDHLDIIFRLEEEFHIKIERSSYGAIERFPSWGTEQSTLGLYDEGGTIIASQPSTVRRLIEIVASRLKRTSDESPSTSHNTD